MKDRLNKQDIMDLLPHREPMLLINELKNIKKLFIHLGIIHNYFQIFFLLKSRKNHDFPLIWSA